jgi:hypothetical protein
VTLTLSDDGRGLPRGEVVRGSGTAIMDAWCAVAGGEWTWRTSPAGGVQVVASFSAVAQDSCLAADTHVRGSMTAVHVGSVRRLFAANLAPCDFIMQQFLSSRAPWSSASGRS